MHIACAQRSRRTTAPLLAALLFLLSAGAVRAQSVAPPDRLPKFQRAPVVDGTLDDPLWQAALPFNEFRTLHPIAGRAPSARTEVRLAYDDSTAFVAIRALDQEPARLRVGGKDPERILKNDWVAFCLDSHGDGLGGYFFLVTPGGVTVAGILGGDGSPIAAKVLGWRAAVRREAHGYTVTMAIPLAQLPYERHDSTGMTFKAVRFVAERGEESDFPAIAPGRPHMAQLRRVLLTGLGPSRGAGEGFADDQRALLQRKLDGRRQHDYRTLAGRVAGWEAGASVLDYVLFPSRPLRASTTPFHFPARPATEKVAAIFGRLEYGPGSPIGDLDGFLTRTTTQSLIVIRSDTVLYEKYFNGFGRDSIMTSFSVAKSFASTLVGIAIDRGLIASVDEPITKYLPELARRDPAFGRIRIADLLHMASGLRYVEEAPWNDDDITYLDPNLRQAALEQTAVVEPPGVSWLYNNYNPLLIGMVLERVAARSVTDLLQDWLWQPLGMEYDGSWSLDSQADGFEKMESGINARAIDFAKLGAMALHDGRWQGQQLVSAGWLEQATQPRADPPGFYGDGAFFGPGGHYYGYFWWGSRRADDPSDFYALGNKGEFIYCSPRRHMVIVRTGMRYGISAADWVRLFRAFVDQFDV